MSVSRRLARNWIFLFTGNVLGQGFLLLGLLHLARAVGPAAFGLWNFSQAWMLMLLQADQAGLEVVAIREVARAPETMGRYIRTVVSVRAVLASVVLTLTVLACLLQLVPADVQPLLLIFSLSLIPTVFLLEWVFEARQEIGYVSAARLLKGIVFAGLVFLFVRTVDDVELSAVFYVLGAATPAAFIFALAFSRHGRTGRTDFRHAIQTLRQAVPVGLAALLSQFCLFAGVLYVGYAVQPEQVGYFTAAQRPVVFLWAYVVSSSHRILLPTMSARFRMSLPDFRSFIEKFFRLSALVALPLGLAVTLVAPVLIPLLYSSAYAESVLIFQVLFWFLVFSLMRFIFEIGLIASDRQRRYFWGMLGLAVSYAILIPVLTQAFGILGTAIATVIVEAAYMAFLAGSFPYTSGWCLAKKIWKPVLAFGGGVLGVLVVPGLSVPAQVGLGLGIYALLLLLTRGVTAEDWILVRNVVRPGNAT